MSFSPKNIESRILCQERVDAVFVGGMYAMRSIIHNNDLNTFLIDFDYLLTFSLFTISDYFIVKDQMIKSRIVCFEK